MRNRNRHAGFVLIRKDLLRSDRMCVGAESVKVFETRAGHTV